MHWRFATMPAVASESAVEPSELPTQVCTQGRGNLKQPWNLSAWCVSRAQRASSPPLNPDSDPAVLFQRHNSPMSA
jgi:hypothetical protein